MKNAYKGIKKIYWAEILAIVSTLALIISTLLSRGAEYKTAVSAAFAISAVLEVIEFILIFIGANQAVKYEKDFKNVRFLVVVLAIIAALQAIFTGNTIIAKGLIVANNALELILIICVIKACISIADDLEEKEIIKKGRNAVKVALATFLVSVGLYLVVGSIKAKSSGAVMILSETMEAIILVTALVILIFAYLMYISMLSMTIRMLDEYL